MNPQESKKEYSKPEIVEIVIDNAISLALESPAFGPGENNLSYNPTQEFYSTDPLKS